MVKRKVLLVLLVIAGVTSTRAQHIAINNNILFDVMGALSAGVEIPLSKVSSVEMYGSVRPENATWSSFNAKTSYCLENCMIAPAQKNGYTTGVIFKAKVEPNNNVYKYNVTTDQLELIVDPNEYPNKEIYYCANRFFNSSEAMAKYISTLDQSTVLHLNAQRFEKVNNDYVCYYNYWIRHLDNKLNDVMGVMEFGVVRNNLYNIRVTDVSDLGHGPDPDYTVPDTPDEGGAKLKVLINVKKWIVRDLNIVL